MNSEQGDGEMEDDLSKKVTALEGRMARLEEQNTQLLRALRLAGGLLARSSPELATAVS